MFRCTTAAFVVLSACLTAFPVAASERGGVSGRREASSVSTGIIGSQPREVVIVHEIFASPPPRTISQLPTILDLPARPGIREAKPEQPSVFILRNRDVYETGSIGEIGEPSSPRPRIIDVTTESQQASDTSFGPKIIHLPVPVGGRR